jgi:hypothetical protein
LYVNYIRVIGQANTISNLSGDLDKEICNLENIMMNAGGNWKEPASQVFQRQLAAKQAIAYGIKKKQSYNTETHIERRNLLWQKNGQ